MDYNYNGYDRGYTEPAMTSADYMNRTYRWMAVGLLITFAAAFVTAATPLWYVVNSLYLVFTIAELVLVYVLSSRVQSMSVGGARATFFAYALLNGMVLSYYFLVFDLGTLVLAFLATSLYFGLMAVYGTTTHRDLSGWGPKLMMGLFALIITGFVGMTVAVTLYKKFAGKISMIGAVICTVMCLIFSVGTNYFCVAKEFVKVFAEDGKYVQALKESQSGLEALGSEVYALSDEEVRLNSDYSSKDEFLEAYNEALATCRTELEFAENHRSIPSCMADMSTILDNYDEGGEIRGNLTECLLWGVLSILLVAVFMIPGIRKQLQEENTIRVLQPMEL